MKVLTRHSVLVACLILFGLADGHQLTAMELTPENVGNVRFRNYGEIGALAGAGVMSIAQDRHGFIWVATGSGLRRLVGSEVTSYRYEYGNEASLSDDRAWVVFVDSQDRVWAGTQLGLCLYDEEMDVFRRVRDESKPSSIDKKITAIVEDDEGGIWMGTPTAGLFRISPSGTMEEVGGFGKNQVKTLFWESGRGLWIGTFSDGVYLRGLDGSLSQPLSGFSEVFGGLAAQKPVSSILVDSLGGLWLGVDLFGLLRVDLETGASELFSAMESERAVKFTRPGGIMEDSHSNVWVGDRSGGVMVYVRSEKRFLSFKNGLVGKTRINLLRIWSLFEDADNDIWIGTLREGLLRVSDSKQMVSLILSDPQSTEVQGEDYILSLGTDRGDRLWVGSDLGGLRRYDFETRRFRNYFDSEEGRNAARQYSPLSLSEDAGGDLWIAAGVFGLFRLPKEASELERVLDESGQTISANVRTLRELDADRMLLGAVEGLFVYSRSSRSFHLFDPSNSENIRVRTILVDSKSRVWVGTEAKGVLRFDGQTGGAPQSFAIEKNGRPLEIFRYQSTGIIEDRAGRIWASSIDEGVAVFDEEAEVFESVEALSGRDYRDVFSLVEDLQGRIWFATETMLFRYDVDRERITAHWHSEDLGVSRFKDSAVARSSSGTLYFGTGQGIVVVDPSKVPDERSDAPLFFTGLKVNESLVTPGQAESALEDNILFAEKITLRPSERSFSIRFGVREFEDRNARDYHYLLEGFETDWRKSNNREALYANLDPGDYVFRVRARNLHGGIGFQEKSIHVSVLPRFFETWWFSAVVIGLVLALILFVFRWRNRMLLRQRKRLEVTVSEQTLELRVRNDELESSRRQLEEHGRNLERIVEERTHDLTVAKERAERLDQLKSSFLANTSHEIRTPLNAIVNFSELIASDEEMSEEEKRSYAEIVSSSSDSLLKLIDDILDISLIESGNIKLDESDCDLVSLALQLKMVYQARLGVDSQIELRLDIPDKADVLVSTDENRLKQVLINLLDNALKFTQHGEVRFGFRTDSGKVYFFVQDSGIGISKDDQAAIFERFHKLEGDGKTLYRGAGLGLSISRKLVDLLGGELVVKSTPGEGATFSFWLPGPVRGVGGGSVSSGNDKKSLAALGLGGKRILLVEDEEANSMVLEAFLKGTGVESKRAESGEEAIRIYKDWSPDCVLMDIKLPDMDGYEAARAILSMDARAVIIGQSAYAMSSDRAKAEAIGFKRFLTKPIERKKLLEVVSDFSERKADSAFKGL